MRGALAPLLCCVVALVLWPQPNSVANQLLGLHLAHDSNKLWRLVLDCAETPDYEQTRLEDPPRLIVDLADTKLPENFRAPALQGSPIIDLRLAQRDDGGLRLVAELAPAVRPRLLRLAPEGLRSHRLALLLYGAPAGALQYLVPGDAGASEVVVVIDAGHGGHDPGAVAASELREKDVVLAVAKQLHHRLNNEPGFAALLTRVGDEFISLAERRHIARMHRAALLLSVHADSIPKSSRGRRPRGVALYMLSGGEASSREAHFLSQRENQSGQSQLAGLVLEQQPEAVRSVLYDLSLNASRQRAAVISQSLLQSVSSLIYLHKKLVEQADFAVLRSPDVPSLLVELGFLSNEHEARRLASTEYQTQLVEALFIGVRDFFVSQPPTGSWLAWRRLNVGLRHTVRSGENLWLLARRYGTSVEAIVRYNGLGADTDMLQEGRALLIPTAQAAAQP